MGMKLSVKRFDELTLEELYTILKLRVDVFVVEQSCAYPELDGIDKRSIHVFSSDGENISAYLRVYERENEPGVAQIGRVIALRRGCGLGRKIMLAGMQTCVEVFGAHEAYLEAQVYARGFYEHLGFTASTEEFDEDGIPHIGMRCTLGEI